MRQGEIFAAFFVSVAVRCSVEKADFTGKAEGLKR